MQEQKHLQKALLIQKNELKFYVRKHLIAKRPELLHKITNRNYLEALIFIEGYVAGIRSDLRLPVIEQDVKSHLLEQGLQYILQKFD